MILSVVAQVQLERYEPASEDPIGLPGDGWAAPVDVDSFGWWQPSADEIRPNPGRRSQEIVRTLMVPLGTDCADRDRWTIPGDGTFDQVGEAQDNSHGPFGMQTPLVIYLGKVKG